MPSSRHLAPLALVCLVATVSAAETEVSFDETFAATARSTGATWAHGRQLLARNAADHVAFLEAQRVSDEGPRRVLANALLIRVREPELLRRTRRLLTLPYTRVVADEALVRLTATDARAEGETLAVERGMLRWLLADLLRERQGATLSWPEPLMKAIALCPTPEVAHEAVVGLARSDVDQVLPPLGRHVVPELVALLTGDRVIEDVWRRAPAAAEVLAAMGHHEFAPQVAAALDRAEADNAVRLARTLSRMDRDLARRHTLDALSRADERHAPELYGVLIELGDVESIPVPDDPRARAHHAALAWELAHGDEVTELADLVLAEGIVIRRPGRDRHVDIDREAAWRGVWHVRGAARAALAGHLPDALLVQMAWVRDGEAEWAEVVRRGLPGHLERAREWLARHPNWSAELLLTALAERHGAAALPDLLAAAASRQHARRLSAAATVLHVKVADAARVLKTVAETQMTRSEADLPLLLLELAAHEVDPSDEHDEAILARAESRDPHVRRLVLLHALRHARAGHVELLARTLTSSDDAALRLAARDALVRIGASVLPAVEGVDSLDPALLAALRLRISRPELVKAVGVALVKHRAYNPSILGPQEHDYRLAGDNLAKEVGPEARPLLEEHVLLSSGHGGGVSEALFALAAIGEIDSVPPILRAVRRAGGIRYAAEALAEFGEEAQVLLGDVPLPDPDRAGYRGRGARHVAAAAATAPEAEQLLAGLAAPRPADPTLAQQWLKRRREYLGLAARSEDARVLAAVDEIAAGEVSDHVEAVWDALRVRPREARRAFLLRVVRNGWALHNVASLFSHAFGEAGVRVLLDLSAELGDPAGHRALDLAQEIAFAPYPETNTQTYAAERAEILPLMRNQFVSGAPARRRALAERLAGLYRVAPEAWIPDELTSWIEEGNEPSRNLLFALGAIGNERTARALFAIYERNHERDIARALGKLKFAPAADLLEKRVWHWIETRPGYWTDMYELVALAELAEWQRVWRVYRDADPMRTRLQAAELLAEAGDERLFEPLSAQIEELIDRSDAALARASVSEEKYTLLQRWKNAEGEWLRRAIAALLTLNQGQALDHLRPRLLRVEAVELRQLLERALPTAQYGDR